jgi:hypothetical protein
MFANYTRVFALSLVQYLGKQRRRCARWKNVLDNFEGLLAFDGRAGRVARANGSCPCRHLACVGATITSHHPLHAFLKPIRRVPALGGTQDPAGVRFCAIVNATSSASSTNSSTSGPSLPRCDRLAKTFLSEGSLPPLQTPTLPRAAPVA